MIKWDDLNWYQKAAFLLVIGIVGWFSPEIALLFHFGGVEVVFAFLAAYMIPFIRQIQAYITKVKETVALAYFAYQTSAFANHRKQIVDSDLFGCFYCLEVYPPSQIVEWVDEDENEVGQTALCPYCGIDSVIGSASGVSFDRQFLTEMYKVWFS